MSKYIKDTLIISVSMILFMVLVMFIFTLPLYETPSPPLPTPPPPPPIDQPMSIEEMIRIESVKVGFDPLISLKIADCESALGKYRINFEGSGAEGLFQFKPMTFNGYCSGDIKSDLD